MIVGPIIAAKFDVLPQPAEQFGKNSALSPLIQPPNQDGKSKESTAWSSLLASEAALASKNAKAQTRKNN